MPLDLMSPPTVCLPSSCADQQTLQASSADPVTGPASTTPETGLGRPSPAENEHFGDWSVLVLFAALLGTFPVVMAHQRRTGHTPTDLNHDLRFQS